MPGKEGVEAVRTRHALRTTETRQRGAKPFLFRPDTHAHSAGVTAVELVGQLAGGRPDGSLNGAHARRGHEHLMAAASVALRRVVPVLTFAIVVPAAWVAVTQLAGPDDGTLAG